MNLSDVKTIFFDYDGTLHNSMVIYKPAFLNIYHRLVDQGYREMSTWSDRDVSRFLGQSPKEMWDSFGISSVFYINPQNIAIILKSHHLCNP